MPPKKTNKFALLILLIAAALGLSFFRVFDFSELQTYDLRLELRPPIKQNQDIVIIEIADDTINELGRWPFDRQWHAALIDVLTKYGAKAICFDVIFSQKGPGDEKLVESAKNSKLVFMPSVFRLTEAAPEGMIEAQEYDSKLLPELEAVCRGTGHINIIPDRDGKNRRVISFIKYKGKYYPQVALLAACDYLGLNIDKVEFYPGEKVKLAEDLYAPVDEKGNILVNMAGTWTETFTHYSYFDILKSFKQVEAQKPPIIDLNKLKDKVCFIGLTATGTVDLNPTSLEPRYPGVGLHANLFNTIVNKDFITRADRLVNLGLLFLLALVASFLTLRTRPLPGFFLVVLITVMFAIASHALFCYGLWVDLFYPILFTFVLYLLLTLYRFVAERQKRLLLENELKVARRIQESFLPEAAPEKEGMRIAASMTPAKEVGGDLYDFLERGREKIGIMVGDVSGKGVPAALFMAKTVSEFKTWARTIDEPSKVLGNLNDQIATTSKSGLFVTISFAVFDMQNKKLVMSSAGHLPLMLLRKDQEQPILLNVHEGMPVGLVPQAEFGTETLDLRQGDVIVFYTDGITEAMNLRREEFGQERLKAVLMQARDLEPQKIIEEIQQGVRKFAGHAPQHDDMTIIVVRIT